jgi:hypothetical protein
MDFMPFYHRPQEWLLESNMELLRICLKLLRHNAALNTTNTYQRDYPVDLDYREMLLEKTTRDPQRFPRYPQVFEPAHGFIPNLSVVDLLFNRGNDALDYLRKLPLL